MKAKTILDAEKKDAIDIATELCYSEEVKRKIAQAKSVYEIGRNTMKSFQNSKMKTIHLKKVVGFYAIDALLLREVLLVYFVVSITPALICRGLRNRWLWLIN